MGISMLKNSEQGYGLVAITLHWLMAVTVIGLFALGLYMVELSYYDAWYKGSLDLHKSVGVSLAIVLILRLAWRISQPKPQSLAQNTLQKRAASAVHLLLYVLLVALVMSGYLISTADGRAIDVFGFFEVPALGSFVENQEDLAGDIHFYLAWTLIIAVAVHALAALKHHFINRDRTLVRMLKVTKGNS